MSNIVKLLADLGTDAALEKEYSENPESVMGRYELSDEEKSAMTNNDVDKVKQLSKQDNIRMNDLIIKRYK